MTAPGQARERENVRRGTCPGRYLAARPPPASNTSLRYFGLGNPLPTAVVDKNTCGRYVFAVHHVRVGPGASAVGAAGTEGQVWAVATLLSLTCVTWARIAHVFVDAISVPCIDVDDDGVARPKASG